LTGSGGRLLGGDLLAEDGGDLPCLYISTSLFWRHGSTLGGGFQGWGREGDADGDSLLAEDGGDIWWL
jgi:hypothetical protein